MTATQTGLYEHLKKMVRVRSISGTTRYTAAGRGTHSGKLDPTIFVNGLRELTTSATLGAEPAVTEET